MSTAKSSSPLAAFTIDELLEEIQRRRNVRQERAPIRNWCDDCDHFVYWEKRGDPPNDWNPCKKKHQMKFRMPNPIDGPHPPANTFGFYVRVCADRKARPVPVEIVEPAPDPYKAPPRGGKPTAVQS